MTTHLGIRSMAEKFVSRRLTKEQPVVREEIFRDKLGWIRYNLKQSFMKHLFRAAALWPKFSPSSGRRLRRDKTQDSTIQGSERFVFSEQKRYVYQEMRKSQYLSFLEELRNEVVTVYFDKTMLHPIQFNVSLLVFPSQAHTSYGSS